MTASAKKKALGNLRTLLAAKASIVLITLGMIYYMLGDAEMYPPWTIVMIALVGAVTVLSVYRDLRA